MAQRRMFSLDIVGSDAFLDMPVSARELYFQLSMRADDEGFVNPKNIMRMIGASNDDLNVLLGKRFLLPFPSGVVVVKHWKVNNYLQNDRLKPTQYIEEKNSLITKENRSYTENIQNVYKMDSQYSIGESSINTATEVALTASKGKGATFKGLQSILDSPQPHIQLIGHFFKKRSIVFDTPQEWTTAVKRWMRVASDLSKFGDERITNAFNLAEEKYPDLWDLGTVLKLITK